MNALDDDLLFGMAVTGPVARARLSHILDDSQAADDCAEWGVIRRERQGIPVDDEELAAVRAGPRVRHGDGAGGVFGFGQVLIGELVAWPTVPRPRRVAALQ